MKTIDFIFTYLEESEKFLLENVLNFIKEDVNKKGGISGKFINFHLLESHSLNKSEITKSFPHALFIQDESFSELEDSFSKDYCLFLPSEKISNKLNKNILSFGNHLCSDETAIEHLLVPSHCVDKVWFFSNSDQYKQDGEIPPEMPGEMFLHLSRK